MILLKKLRNEKGLSTNELARLTGVNRFVITNIENKKYKLATSSMKKLADYFGIADPLELTENVVDLIELKSCLNQKCLLNKEKYCQSNQVCNGAYCQSEYLVSDMVKGFNFNNTQALSIY